MRAGKGGNGGKVNQQQVINQDGKANAGTIVYYVTTVDETFRMSPTLSADRAIKHKLIATLIPNCTYICSAQCVSLDSTSSCLDQSGNMLRNLNGCAVRPFAAITTQEGNANGGNGGQTVNQKGSANACAL